jgi:hypothetical protein
MAQIGELIAPAVRDTLLRNFGCDPWHGCRRTEAPSPVVVPERRELERLMQERPGGRLGSEV